MVVYGFIKANYTFRVIARKKNRPITEVLTHSKVCTSPIDVPFKNPDNVRGHGRTPSNLVIHWTPMPEIDHNSEIPVPDSLQTR